MGKSGLHAYNFSPRDDSVLHVRLVSQAERSREVCLRPDRIVAGIRGKRLFRVRDALFHRN